MFYVYVLRSHIDRKFYIGFTGDLQARYARHCKGSVPATKPRRPLDLIFYEAYIDKHDALRREKYFKTSKGKTTLNSMLREYIQKNPL